MRRKKERSKQDQTNKQGKAKQHTQSSHFSKEKMSCLGWDSSPRHYTCIYNVHVHLYTCSFLSPPPYLNVSLVVVSFRVLSLQEKQKFVKHEQLSLPLRSLLAHVDLAFALNTQDIYNVHVSLFIRCTMRCEIWAQ